MSGFTRTPNYSLYKPTPNADNDAWGGHLNTNADILDTLLGPGGAAPFLPLSGGTVGPLVRTNVSYDMLASGAVGDGVTDDTAKIQAFLNGLPRSVRVVLPATHQFLIDSANLNIPAQMTIAGEGGADANSLLGAAFVLNPAFRITLNHGCRLTNLKILRKGLLSSPTNGQSNAAIAAWAAEATYHKTSASTASGNTLPFTNTSGVIVGMQAYGQNLAPGGTTVTGVVANTSVTFGSVIGYPVPVGAYVRFGTSVAVHVLPNTGGVNIDRLFIMGFHTALLTEAGRLFIDAVEADCTSAMFLCHGGDVAYVSKVHCTPYYGGNALRPGPAFLATGCDGALFDACTTFGWATGFVAYAVGSNTLRRCWFEMVPDGVTFTTGFRSEGWIGSEISLIQCVAGGSVVYDFQHSGGGANLVACASGFGVTDPTAIGHYRLGPGSTGIITGSEIVNSGISAPSFVVQPGVGGWRLVSLQMFNVPSPWITGAAADLANVSILGGAALDGSNNAQVQTHLQEKVWITSPGTTSTDGSPSETLHVDGSAAFGGGPGYNYWQATGAAGGGSPTLAVKGTGTAFAVISGLGTYGPLLETGNGIALWINDTGVAVGNYLKLQVDATGGAVVLYSSGTGGLMIQTGGNKLGFFGTVPIAKPTVSGAKGSNAALASLMAALAAYGLVTDSTTA